ncbi:hypothetical protein AVEN_230212-1 [Araneus ventricosus]|uniref:Uncharacterized protein n=1 Tax=Araneus ventricosus TaxID=182803 RepID=A0A4Y2DUP2_ARAVE|nr:hypothetical protein AVEN_230212-1 [Araneus ventricosus]
MFKGPLMILGDVCLLRDQVYDGTKKVSDVFQIYLRPYYKRNTPITQEGASSELKSAVEVQDEVDDHPNVSGSAGQGNRRFDVRRNGHPVIRFGQSLR